MTRCIVDGCTNEAVRMYVHESSFEASFGVCAFHAQAIIRHGTDEQVRMYVFPTREAAEAASAARIGALRGGPTP